MIVVLRVHNASRFKFPQSVKTPAHQTSPASIHADRGIISHPHTLEKRPKASMNRGSCYNSPLPSSPILLNPHTLTHLSSSPRSSEKIQGRLVYGIYHLSYTRFSSPKSPPPPSFAHSPVFPSQILTKIISRQDQEHVRPVEGCHAYIILPPPPPFVVFSSH